MNYEKSSLQAFALLVRAQQMLIARLTRSEQGSPAPDEALADEAGPETIPEQHLFKVLQVCASAAFCYYLHLPAQVLGFEDQLHALLVSERSCPLTPAIVSHNPFMRQIQSCICVAKSSFVMQAYEIPQASARALLGMDYSATMQASSTPLLLLPIPGDTSQPQHAAAAVPEASCVFSSPSAAQSHDPLPSHEALDRQVSASQAGKRKQPHALCQLHAAPGQSTDLPSAASAQTGPAGVGTPLATQQRPAAAQQHGRAGQREERRMCCALLVPCCEAVHGRFPLNGTYFQTNEVFLDAATLEHPLMASSPLTRNTATV